MTLTAQELFLADTKTKIKQYLYRELEESFDPVVVFMQKISGVGPINWQAPENKQRIQKVFVALAASVGAYTMLDGDFRTYLLLKFVDILYEEFKSELFTQFVTTSYNVLPETVVGALDVAPMLAPPQNTNFPGLENTSNHINPIKPKLVPSSIYND